MQFLPDVMIRCPECLGTRYRPEILEITYRGKNIAEVLELTAREAFRFFRHRPKVQARLRPMLDIGLDYLRLGQPVSTLSGGEAQRLKLAGFLARSRPRSNAPGAAPHTIFLLDEPTAGLHPVDIVKLLDALECAGRSRPFPDRHRAQPRGHGLRRLDHRPGPGRRRRRGPGGGARDAGRRRENGNADRSGRGTSIACRPASAVKIAPSCATGVKSWGSSVPGHK